MKAIYALAALGLIATPVSAAVAQSDIIAQLFDKATEIFKDRVYSETGWQQRGELKQGGEATFTIKLTGGSQYNVVGMCDTDCSNLDAYLTDSTGKLVDSNVEDDKFPIVWASASGTYTLRLVMKACSSEPCAFGAKSFKQ